MSVLDELVTKGLIEAVESDREVASQRLDGARRHLDAARAMADLDPAGASVLDCDAARKSVTPAK